MFLATEHTWNLKYFVNILINHLQLKNLNIYKMEAIGRFDHSQKPHLSKEKLGLLSETLIWIGIIEK